MADLAACLSIPHDDLREAVHWACLRECQKQFIVGSHLHLIDEVIALILKLLRFGDIEFFEDKDVLHAVDHVTALAIPDQVLLHSRGNRAAKYFLQDDLVLLVYVTRRRVLDFRCACQREPTVLDELSVRSWQRDLPSRIELIFALCS